MVFEALLSFFYLLTVIGFTAFISAYLGYKLLKMLTYMLVYPFVVSAEKKLLK
jgi:hypothetical protein